MNKHLAQNLLSFVAVFMNIQGASFSSHFKCPVSSER